MNISVSSPYDRAFLHCGALGPQHSPLPSNVLLEWLTRETGNSRLFLMRHNWAFSTVLCAWVYSPAEAAVPLFQELEAFKADPRQLWPDDLKAPSLLLARLRPLPLDGTLPFQHAQNESKAAHARLMGQASDEKQDMVRSLHRRGQSGIASGIQTGAIPWSPPILRNRDTTKETNKSLLEAAKGL